MFYSPFPTSKDYQETGSAKTVQDANEFLRTAMYKTPASDWSAYRSYIRRDGTGYSWGWVLR